MHVTAETVHGMGSSNRKPLKGGTAMNAPRAHVMMDHQHLAQEHHQVLLARTTMGVAETELPETAAYDAIRESLKHAYDQCTERLHAIQDAVIELGSPG
jgi:hypothetical protein